MDGVIKVGLKKTKEFVAEYGVKTIGLDERYNYISKHINNLLEMSNSMQEILETANRKGFVVLANIGNTILRSLRNIQDYLFNTIANLHHGSINIHLINPEQFRYELNYTELYEVN